MAAVLPVAEEFRHPGGEREGGYMKSKIKATEGNKILNSDVKIVAYYGLKKENRYEQNLCGFFFLKEDMCWFYLCRIV